MARSQFTKIIVLIGGIFVWSSAAFAQSTPPSVSSATPSAFNFPAASPLCTGGNDTGRECITLAGSPTPKKVDVFFLFDDTGSFANFVTTVTTIFQLVASDLQTALPGVDFGFGVGRFEDYGAQWPANFNVPGLLAEVPNTRPFILNQPIVTATSAGSASNRDTLINNALMRKAPGNGGDAPETSIAEGLYQVAVGDGFDGNGDGSKTGSNGLQVAGAVASQTSPDTSGDVPPFSSLSPSVIKSGTVGGAGFRSDALKIVVLATDICPVAAFDRASGIPSTITGTGGTERVEEFHCSSTYGRFGFVSSSKTTAGNGDVSPAGAHTVSQTIAALNANGIRVLGLVPGTGTSAARAKGVGPTGNPATFLSALARITLGVDANGNPLVFFINGGGVALKNNLVQAIVAAAGKPTDISVRAVDQTSNNLTLVSSAPPTAFGVQPGAQACFDLTFGGGKDFTTSSLNLDFFDVASNLTLVKVPTTVSCAQGSCIGDDITTERTLLDANTLELRNQVIRASKRLESYGGSAKRIARTLRADAESLFKESWMIVNSLPPLIVQCPDSFNCQTVSFAVEINSVVNNSADLRDLVLKAVKELNKRGNSKKDSTRRVKNANRVHKENVAVADTIPKTGSSCTSSVDVDVVGK